MTEPGKLTTGSPEKRAWDQGSGTLTVQTRALKRGAASSLAVAVGGATAPTPVSMGTPPQQRRRTSTFVLDGAGTDEKVESLRTQVKDEVTRVWEALQYLLDKPAPDFVESKTVEDLVLSFDRRFARIDTVFNAEVGPLGPLALFGFIVSGYIIGCVIGGQGE